MATTYLQRSTGTPTSQTKFTVSVWVKRSGLSSSNNMDIFCIYSDSSNRMHLRFQGDDIDVINYGGSTQARLTTDRKFRDTNAWFHIVWRVDTTLATADDRVRLYINGVQETSFSTRTNPSQNFSFGTNWNITRIGLDNSASYFDGIMSHFHYSDGYSYGPDTFGSTDATTGEWQINSTPSFTLGNNGFTVLKDGNTITDQSSNSNDFSAGGATLTKTEDNPSNVFATWNFLSSPSNGNVGDVTGSNGNTTTSYLAQYRSYPATLGFKSGKWYWESKRKSTSNDFHLGICSENLTPANQATWVGNTANGWIYAGDGGDLYNNGSNPGSSGYNTFGLNDIIGVAYDADNGKLYFSKNGTWQNSSDPANGTNPAFSGLDTSLFYFPVIVAGANSETNFGNGYFGTTQVSSAGTNASGNGIFEYDVPTGYTALCTKGLNS